MSASQIASIVDYTARLAGGIDGVKVIAGAGQELWDDPLRPGKKVAAAGSDPTEEFTHWSELPTAPGVTYEDQDGTVRLEWTVVMKLFLSRGDYSRIRQVALPFYDRYLAVFAPPANQTLGGLCLKTRLSGFALMAIEGSTWAWLEVRLLVTELVTYEGP